MLVLYNTMMANGVMSRQAVMLVLYNTMMANRCDE